MTDIIESLVTRLDAIAAHNDDEFRYRIDITHLGRGHGLRYEFVCEETADNHPLVSGVGDSIEAAVADVLADLTSIEGWGYRLPPEA